MSEGQELQTTGTQAVSKPAASGNYITLILDDIRRSFAEANEGLDMDFVRMGDWLTIDKKGNFVEAGDDGENFGDNIDVVIGLGEKRWSLWGLEKSPEDGVLIVAEKELADAQTNLAAWLEENPQAQERYSLEDLELRYMAYVVPVASLSPDDFPKVYLMSFSPTATIEYGRWAMGVFQGKAKGVGVPARTGVNRIVTRLSTSEKESRRNSNSWIGIDFTAVGMFNPEDYGINVSEQVPPQETEEAQA